MSLFPNLARLGFGDWVGLLLGALCICAAISGFARMAFDALGLFPTS